MVPKKPLCDHGADERIRTAGLLITNQLLYQLSYIGERHGLNYSEYSSKSSEK